MKNNEKTITGIIGYPLGHTLSPAMHNAVYKKYKMNWEYRVFETPPNDVGKIIKKMKKEGFAALNVTVPYKQTVMKYLDRIDHAAKVIGAVNTVIPVKGKLTGFNTDYLGFDRTLKKNRIIIKNKKVVMLGAGGAAHAIAYALKLRGPSEFHILNIDIPMTRGLVKKLKIKEAKIWMLKKNPVLDEIIASADFIVNCTSVGMDNRSNPYKIDALKRKNIPVYDIIYNPAKTPFLKQAEKKGAKIINGLDMLIYQGMEGFKLWTGRISDYALIKKTVERSFK
ncbi:MAG: shikimate dehydrogenase [Candidatus Goldiibacteriota bacterium]